MRRGLWAAIAVGFGIIIVTLTILGGNRPAAPTAGQTQPAARPVRQAMTRVPHAGPTPSNGYEPPTTTPVPIEICGIGRFPAGTDAALVSAALPDAPTNALLAALEASDSERSHMAALVLGWMRSLHGMPVDEPNARPTWAEQRRQFIDRLAQHALRTTDPLIYSMALNMCTFGGGSDPPPGCGAYSPSDWAELDADNGAAWLAVADQARRDGDREAESSAFRRLAEAHRFDPYHFAVFSSALPFVPKDTKPIERYQLELELIGIDAANSVPYRELSKYCAAARMHDADVHEQCLRIGELMVSKGSGVVDLAIGTGVGERAGWSKARVAKLKELKDALMAAGVALNPIGVERFDCDHVQKTNAYLTQMSAIGEMSALTAQLEQTGETNAEMSRRWQLLLDGLRQNMADD